jgi:hypothetical protein
MYLKWFTLLLLLLVLPVSILCQSGTNKNSAKSAILNNNSSSTTDFVISDFIEINPNPFEDFININMLEEGEGLVEINILSIVGKVVRNINLPSQNHYLLNLSDLEKGIYLLKINNGKYSCVKRIIHQ